MGLCFSNHWAARLHITRPTTPLTSFGKTNEFRIWLHKESSLNPAPGLGKGNRLLWSAFGGLNRFICYHRRGIALLGETLTAIARSIYQLNFLMGCVV
jgi:hypothetical protein